MNFFKKHPKIVIGSLMLGFIIFIALFAPWLAPYHPIDDAQLLYSLEPPGEMFLLGADRHGRDLLSRVMYGARVSLLIGIVTQGINTIIGTTLGLISGFVGGKVDELIMGLTNLLLSLPALILALAIMAVLGPGLINIIIALGFTMWTYTCRVTRAQTLSVKETEFVEASKALGLSNVKIVIRHILPHVLGPVIVVATFGAATAILLESSLSFLGIGTQPPMASWGAMLSRGRDYIWRAPWIMFFPGLGIVFVVLGLNTLGDGLRDYLDPKSR